MNTQTLSANSQLRKHGGPGSVWPICSSNVMSHIAKSWDSFTGQGYNQVTFFQERKPT